MTVKEIENEIESVDIVIAKANTTVDKVMQGMIVKALWQAVLHLAELTEEVKRSRK